MGFSNSDHIIKHLEGRTISKVTQEEQLKGFRIYFTDGESIRFYPYNNTIICTPFDKNSVVKQSTVIMKE